MDTLAKSLVLAVQYIADRDEEDSFDDDIQQLELVASLLKGMTDAERQALERAAHSLGLLQWPIEMGLRDA